MDSIFDYSAQHIAEKRLKLTNLAERSDPKNKTLINAQIEFLRVEEMTLIALHQTFAHPTTARHVGMAMAKAAIEPLLMITEGLEKGTKERAHSNELLTAYFGHTLEIAHDCFGFLDLSVSGLRTSMPRIRK